MAKTRVLSAMTVFALLASTMFGLQPAAAAEPAELAPSADEIWDVTTADASVRHTGRIRALVWDLEEYDGRMFVVGKFLNVKAPDGTLHEQPYVAAFDLETGEWDPTFRPVIDGAVYAMDISDDGRIFVAGELSGGVAAYDIATGERDTSFDPGVINSWGPPAVFDVEVVGNDAYIGGSFTEAQGTDLRNLAKLDTTTGALDLAWLPTADLDTGTPRLAGSLVWAISTDPARGRIYVVGKFGGVNGDDTASYFATLDPDDGSLRTDVPQGIPRFILNHRESFSMWMQDVQWHDDKVYIGGQGHQTITLDADTLTPEHSFFTNRGVGDTYAGGDTQVIFVGDETVWSGCHCWGSVGRYPLGEYIADPGGLQTYDEYRQWVLDFRDIDQFGQQRVNAGYGLDIESNELVPLTFNLRGQAGGYAIFEDSLGQLWMGGQYQSDSATGRVIEGLARFSPADPVAGPVGVRSTLQTGERVVLTWDRLVGAESYEILRDGEVVGSSAGVWFTATGLDAATEYEFSVRAVLADDSVTPASALIVATDGPDVVAPAGLRSTRQTAERVVLTWDRLAGAESYNVLRDGEVVGSSNGVWFTDVGLDAATEYEFSVRAVLADGSVTSASASLSVLTEGGDPVAGPVGVRSTLQTGERVVLTWDRLVGAESYEILRDGEVVGSSAGVWFTATGLDAATEYEFSVRAVLADDSVTPASALIVATQP